MHMMRYEPWTPANTFRREIDRLFNGTDNVSVSQWTPAVDIREEDDRFVFLMDVPGVNPSDIDIEVENGVLTLSGSRTLENTENTDNFSRVERISGKFHRRFTLPKDIDADAVTARSNNGVLEVNIPKLPQVQPRRIEIAVNN